LKGVGKLKTLQEIIKKERGRRAREKRKTGEEKRSGVECSRLKHIWRETKPNERGGENGWGERNRIFYKKRENTQTT